MVQNRTAIVAHQLLTNFDGTQWTRRRQSDDADRVTAGIVALDNTAEDRFAPCGPPRRRYGSEGWGFDSLRAHCEHAVHRRALVAAGAPRLARSGRVGDDLTVGASLDLDPQIPVRDGGATRPIGEDEWQATRWRCLDRDRR